MSYTFTAIVVEEWVEDREVEMVADSNIFAIDRFPRSWPQRRREVPFQKLWRSM